MAPTKKGKKAVAAAPAAQRKTGGGGFVKADWKEGFKKKQVGVSDMTLLSTISNDSINDNLKKRFENAEIYTYIGHVLISVNPFRMLPIYGDDVLHSYRGKNRLEVPPHVYAIAEASYYNMISYKENQCVIISGESGAGKTEAAKRIMQYIAAVAGQHSGPGAGIEGVKEMVLATNPLLESFGCAKTLRNNNSSRHGKYLEIEFDSQGGPVGAVITNYLLEKNRVTGQIDSERNFHIFYQLTKGASAAQRDAYGLQGPEAYAYTSRSNCLQVPGIDDVSDWAETVQAMQVIGISTAEQDDIFRSLATILWLGNVEFREGDDGNAFVADESVPAFVAYLMEVEASTVTKVLTTKVMETQRGGKRGSVYEVPLNPAQASSGRDALAQAIYSNLFDWIVARVNVSMKARAETAHIIGVLDIYGFEIFDTNQFEQLCINYVNEKLQQIFIQLTLKTEQEEYVREQIKWTPIEYFNNKVVCDLIEEKRPPGVFAALNDACATAHADPSAADGSFTQRLGGVSSPQFETRGSKFLVRHYAGDVMYTVAGMTDKNKDVLLKDFFDLIGSSSNQFLQGLFSERPDPSSKKRPPTASDKIKLSANALVEKLMRSQPSYIRTIKPNQNKSPTEYDTKAILHQIKYLGLQENIRVRRAGFAYRNTFEKMVERFYLLSPSTSYAGEYTWQGDAKTGCERILRDTGIAKEEWQMGTTKAFIKNPETLFALEHMRDRYWHNMAGRIQRAFRNYMRYKHECATRIQRFWMSKKDAIVYAQVRDYGHQVLAGRKERRRFSLLSMRRFFGDYLGVGEDHAQGLMLKNAAGISGGETVAFSARAQLLVSKLGRSSKPSPRYLILTDKAVYLLISQVVSGRAQTSLERKIPLVTIKSVGLSTLRDDWIAINVSNSEEADPILSCYFKTEFVTHLMQRTNGAVTVNVAPSISYSKKKDKLAQITFKKDEMVKKDDVYKSHAVSVCTGEPASSVSMPPARRKPGIVRPVTGGKLLRPGGPSQTSNKPRPIAKPLPGREAGMAATPAPRAPASVGIGRAPSAPVSNGAGRAAPPPPSRAAAPPPPPPEPQVDMYKAKFTFETDQTGEMALTKDELVEVVQQDDAGWWLVKKGSTEGWAPSNYLELVPAKPKAAAPPPAPARRAPPMAPAASAPTPASSTPTPRAPMAPQTSRVAESGSAPVSVMPGMGNGGGLAAILAAKRAAADANESSAASTPNGSPSSSRPGSGLGKPMAPVPGKKPPPAVKPKPMAPPKPALGGARTTPAPPIYAPGRLPKMFNRTYVPSHLLLITAPPAHEPEAAVAEPDASPTPPTLIESEASEDTTMLDDEVEPELEQDLELELEEGERSLQRRLGIPVCGVIEEDGPAPAPAQTLPHKRSLLALADAFFPSRLPVPTKSTAPTTTTTTHKRLSLPSLLPRSTQSSPPRSSNAPSRKSLSPSHAARRSSLIKPNPRESLLAPLTGQMHALKARCASLESSLLSQKAASTSEMLKATGRIRSLEGGVEVEGRKLEEELQRYKEESEGWESEAKRLASELEVVRDGPGREIAELKEASTTLEHQLDVEVGSKRRYKDQTIRLRSELNGRRLREIWSLAVMDSEDRRRDAHTVDVEYQLAQAELDSTLTHLRIKELEETVASQSTKLSSLSAARALLLQSTAESQTTIADLRVELALAVKDGKVLRRDLGLSQTAFEDSRTRIEELELEVQSAREGEGQKQIGEKELAKLKSALEKEKAARLKAELDSKDSKAKLKDAQLAQRDAVREAHAATQQLALKTQEADKANSTLAEARAKAKAVKSAKGKTPDPLPSVKVLAARKRRSMTKDGSDPVEALEAVPDSAEEEEGDNADVEDAPMEEEEEEVTVEDPVPPPPAPGPARKARPAPLVVPARDPSPLQIDSPVFDTPDDEDSYRPVKSKSRATAAPPKKRKAAATEEEDDEDAPVPAPKSKVLANKSTNKRAAVKKDKVVPAAAARKKRETTAATTEPAAAAAADDAEPGDAGHVKKKKKMRLLGGPKTFDWNKIEGNDINGLGLPTTLSPVKARKGSVSLGGMLGGGARASSIFN